MSCRRLIVAVALLSTAPALADTLTLPQSDTASTTGTALQITNTATGGTGVQPKSFSGIGSGADSIGIFGQSTGAAGTGVYGFTNGNNSLGVLGVNQKTGFAGEFRYSSAKPSASSSAVFGWNASGSTTAQGAYGNAGLFKVINAQNRSPAVAVTTSGINSYGLSVVSSATTDYSISYGPPDDHGGVAGYFEINSPAAQFGQAAIYAVNSGGQTAAGSNARYGTAGFFAITNTNNFDSALLGRTNASQGTGVEGDDYSSGGGVAVFGSSTQGLSASFSGGSGGSGTCSYDGGGGWSCPSAAAARRASAADLPRLLDGLGKVQLYSYEAEGATRPQLYIGPKAAEFRAAFGVGNSDTTINTTNIEGVALGAAKGIYQRLLKDEATIAAQQAELDALKRQNASMASLQQQLAAQGAQMARLEQALARQVESAAHIQQARAITR